WVALRGAQFLAAYSVALAKSRWDVYLARQVFFLRASWETSWLLFALLPALGLTALTASLAPRVSRVVRSLCLVSVALWLLRFVPATRRLAGRALLVWIAVLALAFSAALLCLAFRPPARRGALVPLAMLVLFALWCDVFFRVRPPWAAESNFIFTAALFVFALWESNLRCGLLPCNSQHEALFALSPVKMDILDETGAAVWSSAGSDKGNADSSIVRTAAIRGGSVRWSEDAGALVAAQKQLREAADELEQSNRLLARQNEIRGRLLALRWQNRLCAEVEDGMRDRIDAARALFATITPTDDAPSVRRKLAQLSVLICAVKRKSHLFLKGRQNDLIPLAELLQAVRESLRCARAAGVTGTVLCEAAGNLPAETALAAYDLCEEALECALPAAPATMLLRLVLDKKALTIRALLDGGDISEAALLPASLRDTLKKLGAQAQTKRDEDGLRLTCVLPVDRGAKEEVLS
ncbi:MAG: hypothetical protein J6Z30_06585, partial [Pyramidobacter sp.]|nr:hypothetical protein [Pyramidobacter sp.]